MRSLAVVDPRGEAAGCAADAEAFTCAPSDLPGATADTTPASAAVNAPAPSTVARRTRRTRRMAASRSRCAFVNAWLPGSIMAEEVDQL
jgi:hypothetical protein